MQVDRDRSGYITPEAITVFLGEIGLQPTPFDMRHIMAELDPTHTGVVSRSAFISFIRHGGQPPPSPAVCPLSYMTRCLPSAMQVSGLCKQ